MMTHPRVTSSPSNHRLSAVWRWRERYLHNARRFMVRALGMTVVVGVGACGGVDSTRAMDEPTQPSETPAAVYVAKTPEPSPEVPFEQGAASTAKPERETVAPRRSDERPPPDARPRVPKPSERVKAPRPVISDSSERARYRVRVGPDGDGDPGTVNIDRGERQPLQGAVVTSNVPCRSDADCMPACSCHPRTCISAEAAAKCEPRKCTANCPLNTMSCGGGCMCQDGMCAAVLVTSR